MIKKFMILILSTIIIIGNFSLEALAGSHCTALEVLEQLDGSICEDQVVFDIAMKSKDDENKKLIEKLNLDFKKFHIVEYEFSTAIFKESNKIIVTAALKKGCSYNKKIEDAIRKMTLGYNTNAKRSLKIKTTDEDSQHISNMVLEILRKKKAEGMDTVELCNGTSTVCRINSANGLYMNKIQIAVVNYPSGTYVVIGTPEITLAY